jgi:hypothetical protein
LQTSSKVNPLVSGTKRYTYTYPKVSIPKKINNIRGPMLDLDGYYSSISREREDSTYSFAILGAKKDRRKFQIQSNTSLSRFRKQSS